MKNKKVRCKESYKEFKKLKEANKAQDYVPGKNIQNIPSVELLDKMRKIAEKLQKECREYLSINERHEIDDYLKFHQK